jgi:translocation and assembly module TamA
MNLYPNFAYAINLATVTGYMPVFNDDFFVLAGKAHIGSIYGSRRYTIPPPERFYAGSECVLRGYKYMTVSPLDREDKPIGGRSIMVYSLETRFRIQSFGWAFFYEVGNVYEQIVPQFFHKQLQSIGLGFRYFTQVGPLRFDLAFPLNPRKGIDKPFQLYISIGQAF